MGGGDVAGLILWDVDAVKTCGGRIVAAGALVKFLQFNLPVFVEFPVDNGDEIEVADTGPEVIGGKGSAGVESDHAGHRAHGTRELCDDWRLYQTLIHASRVMHESLGSKRRLTNLLIAGGHGRERRPHRN